MNNPWIIFGIIILVLALILTILYFLGKRAEKKKAEQDEQLAANAQQITMLVIDKKRMPLKNAGLPQQVIEQTPKLMRRSKLPIVKAKIGPRIMSMIADEKIFDEIPVKKEVKATVSGLYITSVRGIRGPLEKPVKKKKFRQRMQDKYASLKSDLKTAKDADQNSKKSKKK